MSTITDAYGSLNTITITLASLADSSTGVGRQSTIVDNTTDKYQDVLVYISVKLGTSPTSNGIVYVYLIRDDGSGSPMRSDNAGASDAGLTVKNAELIGCLASGASPSTGDVLTDAFLIRRPGPKWGIAVVNNSGVSLNSTGGNHVAKYLGLIPTIT